MSKQTAVKLILAKFNLLSDNDFKSWMLNYHDELIQMERENKIEFAKKCLDKALDLDIRTAHSKVEEYYNQTYGGQDEQQ
jgi:hypothetical protein